jgi:hypothetical protein
MKTAILYSGTIRTLAETIVNNIECFNYGEVDLYFSLWDYVGYSDRINSPDYLMSERKLDKNTIITKELIESIVPKNVNIKIIKVEQYNANSYNLDLINGMDNSGLHAQYYKIWDCFNLLDEKINYDLIVRCRCDIILNNKMDQKELMENVANNRIIFTSKIWYDHPWNNHTEINEMMWISNKELMRKACNIYNNADKINSIIKSDNKTDKNYGESICYMNLAAEGITDNIMTFDFNYNVLR